MKKNVTRGLGLRRLVVAVTALMTLAAVVVGPSPSASAAPKPDWFVDESTLPFAPLDGVDAEQMWGVHNGAGYRIEVPADWNGDLIMWTHGFRGEGERLFFNENEFPPELRQWMLEEGYAWAASTYSKNSYNVAQGVKDTHALSRFFNGKVGKSDSVYVAGYSMGGHIAAVSAENYGNTYSGAMPLCGVTGDYAEFDFFLDATVSAQQLGLGTSQFPVDVAQWYGSDIPAIKDAFGISNPFAFNLTEAGEQYKQLLELRTGGDRPNYDEAFLFWFSIPSGTGNGNFIFDFGAGDGTIALRPGVAVDNSETVYQFDLDPAVSDAEAAFNADVARVSADPQGRNRAGLSNVPPVTGDLNVPVLAMHNLGDLFVPYHHAVIYGDTVAEQGKSDMLVQRAIRGVSHCGFTPQELIEGMSDLIAWAEGGPKPAGDSTTDPAVVASDDYGCTFTRYDGAGHTFATPCP